MRNRVTIVKREFKVNKKKSTVACIMTCRINAPEDIGYAYMPREVDNKINKILKTKTVCSTFVVIGISKCHADDTFDEVLGKRIAESRAKKDAYDKAYKVWHIIYKHYIKMAKLASNMSVACFKAKNVEVEHIIRLKG